MMLLFVAGAIAVAVAGMFLIRWLFDVVQFEEHHDVAGYVLTVVGSTYGVLVAFLVVASWSDFSSVDANAHLEANAIADSARLTQALPNTQELAAALRTYAREVIEEEWPLLSEGRAGSRAQAAYERVWSLTLQGEPGTERERAAYGELLRRVSDIGDARRLRIQSSQEFLPTTLWVVLVAGSLITIAFSYLFGLKSWRVQLIITSLLAASIGFSLYLVWALDSPFAGDIVLAPTAFIDALTLLGR